MTTPLRLRAGTTFPDLENVQQQVTALRKLTSRGSSSTLRPRPTFLPVLTLAVVSGGRLTLPTALQYPEKDDMTAFRVRQLGYVENNRKDVSGPALYAPFGRDLLTLPKKRYHMGELLELPELPPEFTDPIAGVPPYLILNVMLPK